MNSLFTNEFVTSYARRCISRKNSSFSRRSELVRVVSVRLLNQALIVLSAALSVGVSTGVTAGDWPQNYIVQKNSESPDGRYGVVVLSKQAAIDQDQTEGNSTYLANLQTRQTLGEIRGTDYFEGQNHRDLTVAWSPNSKLCLVTDWGRFGFASSSVVKPKDSTFTQTDVGERIKQSLNTVLRKQSRDSEISGEASPHFRINSDGKVRVRALACNNPKQFDDVKTFCALFQGIFDLQSKKWIVTDARPVKPDQDDALESACDDNFAKRMIVAANPDDVPEDFTGSVFSSEQEKLDALDKMMNDVYQAVRSVLVADRSTRVKQEQIAWLKTREAAQSVEEKSKLTENRIRTLQELLW
jgi:hypothetical protein